MRPVVHMVLFAQFILVAASFALAAPQDLQIITPLDRTLVNGQLISVVVRQGLRSIDSLNISMNGKEVRRHPVVQEKNMYCTTIKLDVGLNVITVKAITKEKDVLSDSVRVFYRSEISSEVGNSPPEFQRRPFHRQENERACLRCHSIDMVEKKVKPDTPEASPCHQCHKLLTAYSHVHGPAARWSCLSCHQGDSKPVKYAVQQPENSSCFTCHIDEKKEWAARAFVHGPTATGKCSICHNPHASGNLYMLKKPTWDLCVSCHDERVHRTMSFAFLGKPHPTRGAPNPRKPGDELTCAACHDPHAANSDMLFTYNAKDAFELCMNCHPVK